MTQTVSLIFSDGFYPSSNKLSDTFKTAMSMKTSAERNQTGNHETVDSVIQQVPVDMATHIPLYTYTIWSILVYYVRMYVRMVVRMYVCMYACSNVCIYIHLEPN